MTKEAETGAIADALDKILTLMAIQAPPADRSRTYAEIVEQTEAQAVAANLIRDPVGYSLRLGVEALGERLNEIGGVKVMQAVLHEVAERDPQKEEWRINIMDKRWDGIGSWLA